MYPFSHNTTGMPRDASVKAAEAPMMPPPMMTTFVAAGSTSSDVTEST
jgi:hypothetical protein